MRMRKSEWLVPSGVLIVALAFALMPWWRQIRFWLVPPRPSPISVLEARLAAEKPSSLTWELLRQTKGGLKAGPQFPVDLAEKDGQDITVAGYMAPLDQYETVDRFVLTPLTLDCRICQSPPARDQILVELDRSAELVVGLVVVSGKLALHSGTENTFFYSVSQATVSPGFEGQDPVPMIVPEEHRHLPKGKGPAANEPINLLLSVAVAQHQIPVQPPLLRRLQDHGAFVTRESLPVV